MTINAAGTNNLLLLNILSLSLNLTSKCLLFARPGGLRLIQSETEHQTANVSDRLWENSLVAKSPTVSDLLIAWGRGEPAALEQLTPRVYREIHKLARAYLRRGSAGQSIQPALINEAFLRLLDRRRPVEWENRAHFFSIAAQLMRMILVDHARERHAAKRGGGAQARDRPQACGASTGLITAKPSMTTCWS